MRGVFLKSGFITWEGGGREDGKERRSEEGRERGEGRKGKGEGGRKGEEMGEEIQADRHVCVGMTINMISPLGHSWS